MHRLLRLLSLCALASFGLPALAQTAPENFGGITASRVNNTFFVGSILYPTIQSAVTAACALTNAQVIIPFGVTPPDTIGAATGCSTVILQDQRYFLAAYYTTTGTVYSQSIGFVSGNFGISLPSGLGLVWGGDTGLYRVGAGQVAVGNGTPGSTSGTFFTNQFVAYGNLYGYGPWTMESSTAATSSSNVNSPAFFMQGNYWNGTTTSTDYWAVQNALGTGTNPSSILNFTHTGTSGFSTVGFPMISLPLGSDNRILSALTDAINRNPNTGAMYNANAYGYQWQHIESTTAASDSWTMGVYSPSGAQITPNAISISGTGNVGFSQAIAPAGGVNNAINNAVTASGAIPLGQRYTEVNANNLTLSLPAAATGSVYGVYFKNYTTTLTTSSGSIYVNNMTQGTSWSSTRTGLVDFVWDGVNWYGYGNPVATTITQTGCTITAGAVGNNCNNTVSLPTAQQQPDALYVPNCILVSPSGTVTMGNYTVSSGSSFSVLTVALSTTATGAGTLRCTLTGHI